MRNRLLHITLLGLISVLIACEKPIDIDLPPAPQEIVVEAYINDRNPLLNYVILSRTVDYFNPDLSLPAVREAQVSITEGQVNGSDTSWNTTWVLQEVSPDTLSGLYFNPQVNGKPGYVYRLDIQAGQKTLRSITSIPQPRTIDSLDIRMEYRDTDTAGFLTVYFYDPPERGNNYRMMYKLGGDSLIPGWGTINSSDVLRDDEFINGETWDFRYSTEFNYGDTVHYFLNTLDRKAFLFWNSYFELRGNTGNPFATPVKLESTVEGGIGCFTGYGVTYRRFEVR